MYIASFQCQFKTFGCGNVSPSFDFFLSKTQSVPKCIQTKQSNEGNIDLILLFRETNQIGIL